MRRMISGMIAAVAVMAAAPAVACGYSSCAPCATGYFIPCAAPVYTTPIVNYGFTYGGCGIGCGWVTERLPDPVQQYYYVNQGPTYSGPGNWAPLPTYRESTVSGWGRPRFSYGNAGHHHHKRVLHPYY
jgi:hypothetical protein